MLQIIHHVAIICSNYELSKHFYTEVLGLHALNETFREDRNSYKLDLQVGERYQIELFSFPNPPDRISNPEASGLRHLAFGVENVEQFAAKLQLNGVRVEKIRIDALTGKKFTFFRDPDGLPLELYEM
ncbi:MAG: VOC family protein [Chloroflexota bacterium]|nr:VOC family protein [Chloroflexota bacterium]